MIDSNSSVVMFVWFFRQKQPHWIPGGLVALKTTVVPAKVENSVVVVVVVNGVVVVVDMDVVVTSVFCVVSYAGDVGVVVS